MFIVDGHCDTIQVALDRNVDLEEESLSFNLKQAIKKAPILQMTAAYISPKYEKSFQRACDIIRNQNLIPSSYLWQFTLAFNSISTDSVILFCHSTYLSTHR